MIQDDLIIYFNQKSIMALINSFELNRRRCKKFLAYIGVLFLSVREGIPDNIEAFIRFGIFLSSAQQLSMIKTLWYLAKETKIFTYNSKNYNNTSLGLYKHVYLYYYTYVCMYV